MIHSFLMAGQSNMAGRGFLTEVPQIFDEQIKMLRNGRWQPMVEPVNYDRSTSGISLAASFAAAWRIKHKEEEIGLIPCAEGGASLDEWAVDGALFDHAVSQARLAQRSSTLSGILWHQGEADCFPERAAQYEEKLAVIVAALREALDAPAIPLIIGGLCDFLTEGMFGAYFKDYPLVNQALQHFAETQPDCYFVTAAGLSANPDGVHINAVSQRIFGLRYFEAFHRRQHITEPLSTEQDILHAIYERPLSVKEKTMLLDHRFAGGLISLETYKSALAALKA